MSKILDQVRRDLEKTWQHVPTDMPGDYLQCLMMPEKDNEFILVQPACFKNQKVMDTQMGLVKNATKFGEQNNDLKIEAEGYA